MVDVCCELCNHHSMSQIEFSQILKRHDVTAAAVARGLGINKSTVSRWRVVPPERVLDVERVTGIPRHELRPDLSSVFRDGHPARAA